MVPELSPALLTELRSVAHKTARAAGQEIVRLREAGVEVAHTKSSEVDIVTAADTAAEALIVASLRQARPHDGILGEEGHSLTGTTGITWVIDPIDGTVNYLYGIPAYCVSVAATVADASAYGDGRRPIASAVYNPVTGEMFSAAEGHGATMNEAPIRVGDRTDLATSLVATGFGYTAERRAMQARVLQHIITEVRDIRRIGSAAYDLCLVASGRLDGYVEMGIQPWDWAGAALIATEAGALTQGITPQVPAGSNLFIAGNPSLVPQLQSLLADTELHKLATHSTQ